MSTPFDLTTVSAVKSWQGLTTSGQDVIIGGLITASSRAILAYLGRPSILPRVWNDYYDTRVGMRRIVLRNWPVISVSGVVVGSRELRGSGVQVNLAGINADFSFSGSTSDFAGGPIESAFSIPNPDYIVQTDPWGGAPPGTPTGIDFTSDPSCGSTNLQKSILVTYLAGYQDSNLLQVPTGGGAQTVAPNYGVWALDVGVVYATTGAALVQMATGTTLAAGQYAVALGGAYTFSAADAFQNMIVSFGYIPQDLVQACTEAVALRLTAGSRVGVKSKSLGGMESISYDMAAMPLAVTAALCPYKRVIPL